jgi:hypothetical protein
VSGQCTIDAVELVVGRCRCVVNVWRRSKLAIIVLLLQIITTVATATTIIITIYIVVLYVLILSIIIIIVVVVAMKYCSIIDKLVAMARPIDEHNRQHGARHNATQCQQRDDDQQQMRCNVVYKTRLVVARLSVANIFFQI